MKTSRHISRTSRFLSLGYSADFRRSRLVLHNRGILRNESMGTRKQLLGNELECLHFQLFDEILPVIRLIIKLMVSSVVSGTSPGGVKNSPRTASENSAYDNDKSPSSKSISHQSLTVHEDSARTRLLPEIQHTSADRCCGEEKIGLKLKYFFMAVHLVSIAFVIGMAIAMKTGSS